MSEVQLWNLGSVRSHQEEVRRPAGCFLRPRPQSGPRVSSWFLPHPHPYFIFLSTLVLRVMSSFSTPVRSSCPLTAFLLLTASSGHPRVRKPGVTPDCRRIKSKPCRLSVPSPPHHPQLLSSSQFKPLDISVWLLWVVITAQAFL